MSAIGAGPTGAVIVSRYRQISRIERQFVEGVRSILHGYVKMLRELGIAAKDLELEYSRCSRSYLVALK